MLKPELLLNDLNPLNLEDSRYEYKNKGVPSVTELLSYIDNQGLINWANMIGRKGMNNQDVLKRAAQFGTNTHSAIEKYLKNQDIFVDNSSFKAFINWWDKLNEENKVDIIYTCGPHVMMEAVARVAKEFGIRSQVSLEERMAIKYW